MFWKVCTRCECVSLCSSGQSWQCMNKKSINIDRSQSIRNCRPCKGQIDQMIRTRNFKVRDERVVTGVLVETPKGKNVGVEGEGENAISGKQKDSVQKEMRTVSAAKTTNVERNHHHPQLLRDRRHKMTDEDLRKESLPRGSSPSGRKKPKSVQTKTSKETVRIRRVLIGTLPFANITKQNRDANSAKSSYSGMLRLTVNPMKSRRKVAEKERLPN